MNDYPTTDIAELSRVLLDSATLRTRTAVCVRIESFNAAECSATVTPLVNEERVVEGERIPIPALTVAGCPVIFPAGGGRGLTFGLQAGDLALGLYRHRSHDEVDGGAEGPLNPASTRRMRDADIVVLAGYFRPAVARPPSEFRSDGQPVMPLPSGEALHVGASTGTYMLVREDLLQTYFTSLKNAYDTHVHGYLIPPSLVPLPTTPPVLPPACTVPTPLPSPGNLQTSRVKVDA